MSAAVTPLNAWHKAHGAKMAPFAGWDMPIQYSGILQEHEHTRRQASVFDICHMGEFLLGGRGATRGLGLALTANLETLKPGHCRYGFLLNEEGGILDDLITYRLEEEKYMLVVNAACIRTDLEIINQRLGRGLELEDISAGTGKIDLQGPAALEALEAVFPPGLFSDWRTLPYFGFREISRGKTKILVSRTGYTGELGYELYLPADKVQELWEELLLNPRVKSAGLGARDTLRLEVGLPLNGQDLTPEHSPAEAGYAGMLNSASDYAGKAGALKIRRVLTALTVPGRRSARHGNKVFLPEGEEVQAGEVTSASFAPSLGYAVALAYIDKEQSGRDKYLIRTERAVLEAFRAELPFYRQGTARKKLL
jgi:aminomethyltransferase